MMKSEPKKRTSHFTKSNVTPEHYNNNNNNELIKIRFKPSIGQQLIPWFIVISILTIGIVGLVFARRGDSVERPHRPPSHEHARR